MQEVAGRPAIGGISAVLGRHVLNCWARAGRPWRRLCAAYEMAIGLERGRGGETVVAAEAGGAHTQDRVLVHGIVHGLQSRFFSGRAGIFDPRHDNCR